MKRLRVVEAKTELCHLAKWLDLVGADADDRSPVAPGPTVFQIIQFLTLPFRLKPSAPFHMQRVLYASSSRTVLRNAQVTAGRRGAWAETTSMAIIAHPNCQASVQVLYGVW